MDPQVQLHPDFLVVQPVLLDLMDQLDQWNQLVQIALDHPYHPLFQEILEDLMVQEILQVLADLEAQTDPEAQLDPENQYLHVVQPDQENQFLQLIQDLQLHHVVRPVLLVHWDLMVLGDQESLLVQTVPVDLVVHYHLDFQVFQVIPAFLVALPLLGDRMVPLDQHRQVFPVDPELLGPLSDLCHRLDLSDPPDLTVPLVHLHPLVLWDPMVQADQQNLMDPVVQHLLCFQGIRVVRPDQCLADLRHPELQVDPKVRPGRVDRCLQ